MKKPTPICYSQELRLGLYYLRDIPSFTLRSACEEESYMGSIRSEDIWKRPLNYMHHCCDADYTSFKTLCAVVADREFEKLGVFSAAVALTTLEKYHRLTDSPKPVPIDFNMKVLEQGRAEWSRKLRELQAAAREKERNQVRIDIQEID